MSNAEKKALAALKKRCRGMIHQVGKRFGNERIRPGEFLVEAGKTETELVASIIDGCGKTRANAGIAEIEQLAVEYIFREAGIEMKT